MTEQIRHRAIVRASAIIGAAQLISVILGLIKIKAVASLLGPAGVGLFGIYSQLMQTAAMLFSIGISNSGARQIAAVEARDGLLGIGRARKALLWGSAFLAAIGATLFWLGSEWLTKIILADLSLKEHVAWLSIGVALSVLISYQTAVLSGLRMVTETAIISVGVAITGTTFGVASLWLWGKAGLPALILVAPITSFVLGFIFLHRIRQLSGLVYSRTEVLSEWSSIARLGATFMISGVVTLMGQLAARVLVQRELGTNDLGQFQAAWSVSAIYLGFVLSAMSSDYYSRLTAVITDRPLASRMVNEQIEVALMLSAPVLLGMLGCAHWIIPTIYSTEFEPAIDILRWLLLADIIKLISIPLAFVVLANGSGKIYVITEVSATAIMLITIFLGIPVMGVTAIGIAYLSMYILYLPSVWYFARKLIDFEWSPIVVKYSYCLIVLGVTVTLVGKASTKYGALSGLTLSLSAALYALWRFRMHRA